MAAFTTAAIVGAALVGAATVHSVNKQRKEAKKQAAVIEQKQQQQITAAKTTAREKATLDAAREDSGATIKLGRGDSTSTDTKKASTSAAGSGGATKRTGSVSSRVGGVGPSKEGALFNKRRNARLSKRVGL